jgi:hypothetical protein
MHDFKCNSELDKFKNGKINRKRAISDKYLIYDRILLLKSATKSNFSANIAEKVININLSNCG